MKSKLYKALVILFWFISVFIGLHIGFYAYPRPFTASTIVGVLMIISVIFILMTIGERGKDG